MKEVQCGRNKLD